MSLMMLAIFYGSTGLIGGATGFTSCSFISALTGIVGAFGS